jgi:hypothetical protein
VDEVASRTVGAEARGVEGAAKFRLVLGVAAEVPQLIDAMGKLALVAILAGAGLLKGSAKLRLVVGGDGGGLGVTRVRGGDGGCGR